MPTVCRFDGIDVRMYFAEHDEPHLHAFKAEHNAKYFWRTDEWIGALPKADAHKIKSWAGNRQQETGVGRGMGCPAKRAFRHQGGPARHDVAMTSCLIERC